MNKKENECRILKGSEMTRHRCNTHICVYTKKNHRMVPMGRLMKENLQDFSLVDAEVASSSSYSTSSRVGKGAGP